MMNKRFASFALILSMAAFCTESSAQGPGGRPSFDRLLEAFDTDVSESLSEDEVPGRVWSRLSNADADGDGHVTREEFDGYKP